MRRTPPPLEAPAGTRDLLFAGARRLRACERAIERVFGADGFEEVVTPTIERAELFADMEALRASDVTGHSLAVRADFTSQVARIAATRLRGMTPLKLWYRGPVVRDVVPGRLAARERLQCGLELIGDSSVDADAQVLSLAVKALEALGLPADEVRLSVGSTSYFAAQLVAAGVSADDADRLRTAIDRKSAGRVAELVQGHAAAEAFAFLARPERQEHVLEEARKYALGDDSRAAIDRLSAVATRARELGLGARLEVDLGEVRGLGYYTGLVFNAYVAGAPGPVGGGGRYDTLLARFGDPRPAVGFSLELEALAPLARFEAA